MPMKSRALSKQGTLYTPELRDLFVHDQAQSALSLPCQKKLLKAQGAFCLTELGEL